MEPYQRVGAAWKPYALKRVTIKPFPVRWELVEDDFPARGSFYDYFGFPSPPPDNFLELWLEKFPLELLDEFPEVLPTYGCSKVGGWPDLVQGRIFHRHPAKPEYVFQVAAERQANLYWVDAGWRTSDEERATRRTSGSRSASSCSARLIAGKRS
jgi:hypothetical protein